MKFKDLMGKMSEVKSKIKVRYFNDSDKLRCNAAMFGAELSFRSICDDWDNITWTEL